MRKKLRSSLSKIRQQFSRESFSQWKNRPKDWKQILLYIGLGLAGLVLLGVLVLGISIAIISIGLPDVRDLDKMTLAQSTTIYDRNNQVLYVSSHNGENREYVSFDKISPNIVNAVVAIEDKTFWTHSGFNPSSLVRAFLANVFSLKTEQGGSTITQQYIKNTFLSPEKSYLRKLKELILSIQLEQAYDKKKILELYLNKIFYGNTAYGIEKAAQIYFNKHASETDLAESVILAAIPNRPSAFDPYGPGEYSHLSSSFDENSIRNRTIRSTKDLGNGYVEGLIGKIVDLGNGQQFYLPGRSDEVLQSMLTLHSITQAQKDAAWNEIQHIQFSHNQQQFRAPHFVFYILDQLDKKYGKEIVEQGGLKVYTTLDANLQDIAEKAVQDGALSNEKKYNAKNAGLVAMDPTNGQILAMVGSRNYNDTEIDGKEDVTRDYLQPGSSFKPFVYSQAFLNRYGPGSPVYDTPISFAQGDPPKNFSGDFDGAMTIRSALGQSRNIPAIKAFYAAGGQDPIIALTEKMGLDYIGLSKNPNFDFGWPLAIGSAEVRPIDMVEAYSVFAAGGIHHSPVSILKVENNKGEVLEEWKEQPGEQVLDPQVAYLITNILSDTSVRLHPNLTVPGQINAAKSGTSDMTIQKGNTKVYYPKDLWTMGYTTHLVAGVWAGNNNPKTEGPISNAADGINVAAPIWRNFMTQALKNTPAEDFPVPPGIQQVSISVASGKLPGPNTPPDQIKKEYFASFSVPTEVDDSFTTAQIDSRNGDLANEFCPEESVKTVYYRKIIDLYDRPDWIKSAADWIQKHNTPPDSTSDVAFGAPPETISPLCTPENFAQKPTVTILNLHNGQTVASSSKLEVDIQAQAQLGGISKVEFYLDNTFKFRTVTMPYTGQIRLPIGEAVGTHHTITAKVFDQMGYSGENNIEIVTGPSTP